MKPVFLILILIFIITSFLLYRYSYHYYRSENSDKLWKLWGLQTSYWEGIIIVSSIFTAIIALLLKLFVK